MTDKVVLTALLMGKAVAYARPGILSAIAKQPVLEPQRLSETGLAGDEQGDLLRHGGKDKALHHYPLDHYHSWRAELKGELDLLKVPGAFGENISTSGMTEQDVCVGDVYQVGPVFLEVSQARQPCWKLNVRFGISDMSLRVQSTGRTGWYYRVLEPGVLAPGDRFRLKARPYPKWPLSRLIQAFYVKTMDPSELAQIADLEVLPERWRQLAVKRLESGQIEDWSIRLNGPVQDALEAGQTA